MPSQTSSITVDTGDYEFTVRNNGRSHTLRLNVSAAGTHRDVLEMIFAVDGTSITDTRGRQVAASVPAAVRNALTNLVAALDASIAAAAAAGKLPV